MTLPLAAPLTPEEITRRSGSSFLVSFLVLEPPRRAALTSIYAFCRVVDDAVDDAASPAQGEASLEFWRQELALAYATQSQPQTDIPQTKVGQGIRQAAQQFGVQQSHLQEIVAGMAMDLQACQYPDLQSLENYCYKAASAVGLACLPVLGGDPGKDSVYAESLGKALQFTNILRDLRRDAEVGRVYAPQDMLQALGVPAGQELAWLSGSGPDSAYAKDGPMHQLVQQLGLVAEQHYAKAAAAFRRPTPAGLMAAEIMGAVYRQLLQAVYRRAGDLRAPLPRVPRWQKLYLALRTRMRGRR